MTEPAHLGPAGDALSDAIKSTWHTFLDTFEPLRPELYRYCRHLTKTTWDAEDLTQDTLGRAFVTLGTLFQPIENPRAWLFRVASNLWLDRLRRARSEQGRETLVPSRPQPEPREQREAAATLLAVLSPQERAAVVLKDVFAFSIDEVAQALSTTPGAVKAALHRGRTRLAAPTAEVMRIPKPAALDAFCAAFNAHDLDALTSLLLDTSLVQIVGVVTEYGAEQPKNPRSGSLAGMLSPITSDDRGGVADEYLAGYRGGLPRAEVRAYGDDWVLLLWYPHDEGEAVRTVMAVECEASSVMAVRNSFFTPDVIAEVCGDLQVPYRVNGYRYWL
jgi:RNA polymerase sigma-70 factor (ECF subfamily)